MNKLFVSLLILSFTVIGASPVQAEDPIVMKIATVAPEGTPWEKQLRRFKKYVEKESGGRIKVKMFMGGSLGGEKALVRRTASGSIQCFGGTAGALGTVVPALNVIEAPYLFTDYKHADRVLDGPLKNTVRGVVNKKGFEFGFWAENGFRSWFTKDKAIKAPADLKGLRMRSQESAAHLATYRALGASPVPIAITDVLTSLQTGVVDGFDNTPLYAFAASWYQSSKHLNLSRHSYQPGIIVYSKKWFDKLPADIQKILTDVPKDLTEKGRAEVRKMEPLLVKNLKKYGVTVHEPSAAERKAFEAATKSVAAKVAKKGGKDGAAILKAIQATK